MAQSQPTGDGLAPDQVESERVASDPSPGFDAVSFGRACAAVQDGHSVLVVGEAGSGAGEFALALVDHFADELDCAIATYKGAGKTFLQTLAKQWAIPLEAEPDERGYAKSLTMEQLKEEIAANASERWLLILPEARRLTTGIRYWLEDLQAAGVRLVAFAPVNPGRDIFLEMLEVELELPSDAHIRLVMAAEANRQGLAISKTRLAELQPLAGRNPLVARKVIRREKLGLNQTVEHAQYVVIMPVIIAALFSFAVLRFIGLGTNNMALYLVGGVCLVVGMALKQLGQVRGARKRFGQ